MLFNRKIKMNDFGVYDDDICTNENLILDKKIFKDAYEHAVKIQIHIKD